MPSLNYLLRNLRNEIISKKTGDDSMIIPVDLNAKRL